MLSFVSGLLILLASLVLPVRAEQGLVAQRELRVTDASGQVTLRAAEDSKHAVAVTEETPLSEGDVVETGLQSRAEIILDGDSVFRLQPGSQLRIKTLDSNNTLLELHRGALVAKVKPLQNPAQNLTIKMPTAVVGVRGTEFAADTANSVSYVGVFDEGHVQVSGAWGREHVQLAPNQETRVALSAVPQPAHKIVHLKIYRAQMPHIRARAVFWHKAWKPLPIGQKSIIRRRLAHPDGSISPGFRRIVPVAQHRKARRKRPL